MINGAWKMLCNKGCGWNETHSTKYHDEYQQLAATLKSHHTILIGLFLENLTLLPPLLLEYLSQVWQVPHKLQQLRLC